MMQRRQCSCYAPSGGQHIQQLVGRSDFKCVTELSGRCWKELECPRHFQIWGSLHKEERSIREIREIRQREHRRASESERGKKKRFCLRACVVNSTPDCQKVVSSIFGQIELRGVYGHSDLSASVAVHIMPRNPPQVPFFPFFRKGRKLHAPFL